MEDLNEALRLLRVLHDFSQREMAARLGISYSYINQLERNVREPTLSLIERYAKALDMKSSSILGFADKLKNARCSPSMYDIRDATNELLCIINRRYKLDHPPDTPST